MAHSRITTGLVTIHDRTGRLVGMPAEFAAYFGVEVNSDAHYPPFPWWPEESRDALQLCFDIAISARGAVLEGLKFEGELRTATGEKSLFLISLAKLPDGNTAFYAEPCDPHRYSELVDRALDLGRIARRLGAAATSRSGLREDIALLTPRERAVVKMLLDGHSADRIAQDLHISVHTARNHRKSIFSKLDVQSHVELIAKFGGHDDL